MTSWHSWRQVWRWAGTSSVVKEIGVPDDESTGLRGVRRPALTDADGLADQA